MKAKIIWQFGGDSISIDGPDGSIVSADGGHAKREIFRILKEDAGISPQGRRLNDDYGTPHNPAPLGVARFWSFEAELSDEVINALRTAQEAVYAESEEIHQEALAQLRVRGIHTPISDKSIAEIVRADLLDCLHVSYGGNSSAVYLVVPAERLEVTDEPNGRGMDLKILAANGQPRFFRERYNSPVICEVLRHLIYVRNVCYNRPPRSF